MTRPAFAFLVTAFFLFTCSLRAQDLLVYENHFDSVATEADWHHTTDERGGGEFHAVAGEFLRTAGGFVFYYNDSFKSGRAEYEFDARGPWVFIWRGTTEDPSGGRAVGISNLEGSLTYGEGDWSGANYRYHNNFSTKFETVWVGPSLTSSMNHVKIHDDGDTVKIYINGQLIHTSQISPLYRNVGYVEIGCNHQLDTAAFDNIVITRPASASPLDEGLVASYPFSGDVLDASGNGNDGTMTDAQFVEDRFETAESALFYDSDADRADIPARVLDNIRAGTIAAWIKLNDNAAGVITVKQHDYVNTLSLFTIGVRPIPLPQVGTPGKLYFYPRLNGPGAASSAGIVGTGQWHHVAVVFDTTHCEFFIDGVEAGAVLGDYSVPSDLFPSQTGLGTWIITGWTETIIVRTHGILDDVRIYGRGLSAAEIESLVVAGGWTPPPVAVALRDTTIHNAGRVGATELTFSGAGSQSPGAPIDDFTWYVNGVQVSTDTILVYGFHQGTNRLKLVVTSTAGRDSSEADVTIDAFSRRLGGPVTSGLSMIGDSLFYAVARGDAIYRLDGELNTDYFLQVNGDVLSASSISADTTVYVGSTDFNLYAFTKYGAPAWPSLPLGGLLSMTPTVDEATNRVFVGVRNRNFFSVNRSTGQVVWSYFTDAPIDQSAIITIDRKLVFSTRRGTVYGFDLLKAQNPTVPDWLVVLGDSIASSPAADVDGNIVVSTKTGYVAKLFMPRQDGATVAWYVKPAAGACGTPVIDGHGRIFVGSADSSFYALDAADGSTAWSRKTGGAIRSTPAISDAGTIYVANDAGEFLAFDSLGATVWSYRHPSAIRSPILWSGGTVYFGTEDSLVVAIYEGSAPEFRRSLSSAVVSFPAWGTYMGNNQRTGGQRLGAGAVYPHGGGWNLVSVPMTLLSYDHNLVFPAAVSPCYRFNGQYAIASTLQPGEAYWVKFPSAVTVVLRGTPIQAETVAVVAGWNLVGSIGVSAPVGSITSIPPGMVTSSFFGYNAGYGVVTSLEPGDGYWVKTDQAGSLVLSASTPASAAGRITVVPTSELPPPPPDQGSGSAQLLPTAYGLRDAYPSPFNPSTTIRYELPAASRVLVRVFNMLGQEVARLVDAEQAAGYRDVVWDAVGQPSGIYVVTLEASSLVERGLSFSGSRKLVLMK